eukprot:scaffold8566_cov141-Isochrysis_galbana.AAC.2
MSAQRYRWYGLSGPCCACAAAMGWAAPPSLRMPPAGKEVKESKAAYSRPLPRGPVAFAPRPAPRQRDEWPTSVPISTTSAPGVAAARPERKSTAQYACDSE